MFIGRVLLLLCCLGLDSGSAMSDDGEFDQQQQGVVLQPIERRANASPFGTVVRMSQDGMIVAVAESAYKDSTAWNSVYVFVQEYGVWKQQFRIDQPDGMSVFGLGLDITRDGNLLAVTACSGPLKKTLPNTERHGRVLLYSRNGDQWVHHQTLEAGYYCGAYFSNSRQKRHVMPVFIRFSGDGNTLFVSGIGDDGPAGADTGAVYVFWSNGSQWEEKTRIVAPQKDFMFGFSLAPSADGKIIAIGTWNVPGGHYPIYVLECRGDEYVVVDRFGQNGGLQMSDDGKVIISSLSTYGRDNCFYVYERRDLQQKWSSSETPVHGEGLRGGLSLRPDGKVIAAATPYARSFDGKRKLVGGVNLYFRNKTHWDLIHQYQPNDLPPMGCFGNPTLSADGSTLAVGMGGCHPDGRSPDGTVPKNFYGPPRVVRVFNLQTLGMLPESTSSTSSPVGGATATSGQDNNTPPHLKPLSGYGIVLSFETTALDGVDMLILEGEHYRIEHRRYREMAPPRVQWHSLLPKSATFRLEVHNKKGRSIVRVVQQPREENRFVAHVLLDDGPPPGAAPLSFDLVAVPLHSAPLAGITPPPPLAAAGSLFRHQVADLALNGNYKESSGRIPDGIPHGGVHFVEDRFGNANSALACDGKSSYVDFGSYLGRANNLKTLCFWAYVESFTGTLEIISYYGPDPGQRGEGGFEVIINVGTIQYWFGKRGDKDSVITVPVSSVKLKQWYHICVVHGGAGGHPILIYVNGNKVASGKTSPSIGSYTNFQLCSWTKGPHISRFFHGRLDDIHIFDKALSAKDVRRLFESENLSKSSASQHSSEPATETEKPSASTESTFTPAPPGHANTWLFLWEFMKPFLIFFGVIWGSICIGLFVWWLWKKRCCCSRCCQSRRIVRPVKVYLQDPDGYQRKVFMSSFQEGESAAAFRKRVLKETGGAAADVQILDRDHETVELTDFTPLPNIAANVESVHIRRRRTSKESKEFSGVQIV